jgi:hypothetical protein
MIGGGTLMIRGGIRLFMAVALAVALGGCATLFKGSTQVLPVNSEPMGAEVFVDGVSVGRTPIQLRLAVNRSYTITVRDENGRERAVQVVNQIGAVWVVLNVLGGLVPVIVDAATGAWFELQPGQVNVVLR